MDVDLVLEDVADGMVVTGHLRAVSEAECRRCLDSVTEELDVSVREIFEEHPTEGETWPIEDDHIDLEPMVRAAVMLALPLAPLCRDECRGPVPERFPTGAVPSPSGDEPVAKDPRWAALDELRFDE